jgi:hypothetical protein
MRRWLVNELDGAGFGFLRLPTTQQRHNFTGH